MPFVHRPILMTDAGVIVAGHHRAAEAGAAVLRRGGNAVDAAVTAATVLCVAVPHMNGIGGDAFGLIYQAATGQVTAVNGSGAGPRRATREAYAALGYSEIPARGPLSISTCGVVHAWETILAHFGTIGLSDALLPAAALAEDGVPIDRALREYLMGAGYAALVAASPGLAAIFGPPGPRLLGERLRQPALARTLRAIMSKGAAELYGGATGQALAADLARLGALMTIHDLEAHRTMLAPSLQVGYRGRQVHVAPPNSQGLALALMLGLWEEMEPSPGRSPGPEKFLQLRRTAFAERDRYVADPSRTVLPPDLLSPDGLRRLLEQGAHATEQTACGGGDTSTLVVIDRAGNAVSWVQSLFEDFGSGTVSPSTGIVMHDRLYLERLDDDPVRGLRSSMRPFHTLCPALVVGEAGCEVAIATPGDHGQPQGLFQVLTALYDGEADLQEAIEAPRMRHDAGIDVWVEARAPRAWLMAIESAGLRPVDVGPWSRLMGGVNAIQRRPDGLLLAGGDPRRASWAVCA